MCRWHQIKEVIYMDGTVRSNIKPGPKKRHEIETDHNYLLEVLPETAYN